MTKPDICPICNVRKCPKMICQMIIDRYGIYDGRSTSISDTGKRRLVEWLKDIDEVKLMKKLSTPDA